MKHGDEDGDWVLMAYYHRYCKLDRSGELAPCADHSPPPRRPYIEQGVFFYENQRTGASQRYYRTEREVL